MCPEYLSCRENLNHLWQYGCSFYVYLYQETKNNRENVVSRPVDFLMKAKYSQFRWHSSTETIFKSVLSHQYLPLWQQQFCSYWCTYYSTMATECTCYSYWCRWDYKIFSITGIPGTLLLSPSHRISYSRYKLWPMKRAAWIRPCAMWNCDQSTLGYWRRSIAFLATQTIVLSMQSGSSTVL